MFCFKTCVQSDLDAEVDNIINIDLLCVGLLLKFKLQEPTWAKGFQHLSFFARKNLIWIICKCIYIYTYVYNCKCIYIYTEFWRTHTHTHAHTLLVEAGAQVSHVPWCRWGQLVSRFQRTVLSVQSLTDVSDSFNLSKWCAEQHWPTVSQVYLPRLHHWVDETWWDLMDFMGLRQKATWTKVPPFRVASMPCRLERY